MKYAKYAFLLLIAIISSCDSRQNVRNHQTIPRAELFNRITNILQVKAQKTVFKTINNDLVEMKIEREADSGKRWSREYVFLISDIGQVYTEKAKDGKGYLNRSKRYKESINANYPWGVLLLCRARDECIKVKGIKHNTIEFPIYFSSEAAADQFCNSWNSLH